MKLALPLWLLALVIVILGARYTLDGMLAGVVVFAFIMVSIFGAAPILLGRVAARKRGE